jgi:hypothetical protein
MVLRDRLLYKLSLTIELINTVATSTHPFKKTDAILDHFRLITLDYISKIAATDETSQSTLLRLNGTANSWIEELLPDLGFIIRSTNERNPFDILAGFNALTRRILTADSELLLSSEWDHIPFTYPINPLAGRKSSDPRNHFIYVALPPNEIANFLSMPLAAHEIGHSAWQLTDGNQRGAISAKIHLAVEQFPASKGVRNLDLHDNVVLRQAEQDAFRQAEEIFCDFVGQYVFSFSFVDAFEYYLCPGHEVRHRASYPKVLDRLQYLEKFALRIRDPAFFSRVRSSFVTQRNEKATFLSSQIDTFDCSDYAAKLVLDDLMDLAVKFLRRRVPRPKEKTIVEISDAFLSHFPYAGPASIPEIICAGWKCLKDANIYAFQDKEAVGYLNELVLKTIESNFQSEPNDPRHKRT